ncbi:hypothetical protein NL526_30305, partial [Klebsiella pneumoniae]|nr:hypothetical protein [Klebsiella pneumoniae]
MLGAALEAVAAQIAACPTGAQPEAVAAFAHEMVSRRDAAMVSTDGLDERFAAAIATAPEGEKLDLAVARA